jgi:uroporphyrin-3 C-methyltransferase
MGEPENEVEPSVPAVVADQTARPVQTTSSAAPNRGGRFAWLVALVALILAGVALWRVVILERGQGDAQSSLREETDRRIAEIARTADERKRNLDTLRARVDDADTVNKSVREELLALGERSRHVEDAVANLAEQRLTGRDALALNEAEFLLQLAEERLELFRDAPAALAAYRLADSALAAAEDPVFAGVRQTIGAEMRALESAKPLETNATLAALDRVGASLATLPAKTTVAPTSAAPPSRFEALLQQFVHISSDHGAAPQSRDLELTRSLAAIDLRAAQAALLARDPAAYTAALARARTAMAGSFDANADAVKQDLAELDRLATAPLAPALPELGSALRELRNLRATRALAQPRAPTGDGAGR